MDKKAIVFFPTTSIISLFYINTWNEIAYLLSMMSTLFGPFVLGCRLAIMLSEVKFYRVRLLVCPLSPPSLSTGMSPCYLDEVG